ncbi:MAG: porin [Acidobacteriota bacterium]
MGREGGNSRILVFALLVFGVLLARNSLAEETFFYVEKPAGGRIYVFHSMTVYNRWSRTGEIENPIVRPEAGPAGETLVFDSNAAIHLYNFKHDLPGEILPADEPARKGKPAFTYDWKDGKTRLEGEHAKLEISNRIQIRLTDNIPEAGQAQDSFRIRRAKTKFEGWIYGKSLTYKLQMNWADSSNQELEDALLDYDVTRGREAFHIKAGQFKAPFGRQELTSSGKQQFVDRSIVSERFVKGRDIGLQFWGQTPHHMLEWQTGIFNGNGRNKTSNDNDELQFDARVNFQPFGDVKYSESDFESHDRPLLAIAAQFEKNNMTDSDPTTDRSDLTTWGGDIVFKFKGLSVFAEYFRQDIVPEAGKAFDADGINGQIGYFIYRRHVEIALRYATLDPSDLVTGDDRRERGLAVNWFIHAHALKLQADYRQLKDDAIDSTVYEARLQMQFIF